MSPLVIERHALGPRLHVLGRRVHECHVGLVLAGVATLCVVAHAAELLAALLALVAVWLLAKDWRDLHPATRDTAAWSLGLHRRPDGPPAPRLRDRVPVLAAAGAALVGAINVGSVAAAHLPARVGALLALGPAGEVRLAHALALPAGLALIGVAWPLAKRRRRAVLAAVALLAALGTLTTFKAFDVEVAAISWTLAAVLWRSRDAFWVRHERLGGIRALWFGALVLGAALAGVGWVPDALGVLGAGAVAVAAARLLAPLRPRAATEAHERDRAAAIVRLHGSDTLSAFKLRRDLARHFSPDGRAMAGYRIEAGAMLVAGDPVGPADALPALLEDVVAFARRHGVALGAVGASREFADAARGAGLRRVYLGDEAILRAGPMDLSGGERKSLRKAVNRVARNGFSAELHTVGALDPAAVAELDHLSARWREGAAERGFSMAHDALADDLLRDASVVVARDADGRVRGFLHFVPVFGRRAVSLAFMRRDRDTPNGVTDFLVVEAARLLGERGIEELSLNFAAFGRWLREPANGLERCAARVFRLADRWFQIERLLRFNAKFQPRWQPRYLLFAGPAQLPRVVLATLLAEGHLQVPRLRAACVARAARSRIDGGAGGGRRGHAGVARRGPRARDRSAAPA